MTIRLAMYEYLTSDDGLRFMFEKARNFTSALVILTIGTWLLSTSSKGITTGAMPVWMMRAAGILLVAFAEFLLTAWYVNLTNQLVDRLIFKTTAKTRVIFAIVGVVVVVTQMAMYGASQYAQYQAAGHRQESICPALSAPEKDHL